MILGVFDARRDMVDALGVEGVEGVKVAAEKTAKFGDDMGVGFMLVGCPHSKSNQGMCPMLLRQRNTNKNRTLSIVAHLHEIGITKSLKISWPLETYLPQALFPKNHSVVSVSQPIFAATTIYKERSFTQQIPMFGDEEGIQEIMKTPLFLPTPTPEGVETFRTLYQTRFGRILSLEQARELASSYLLIYSLGTSAVDKENSYSTINPQKP